MRSLMLAALLVASARSALTPAQETTPRLAGTKVVLRFEHTPVRRALEELFQYRELLLIIEPEVPDRPVALTLDGLDFASALKKLTGAAGLTYRKASDITYIIAGGEKAAPPAAVQGEKRYTLDFRGLPFRRAIEELFRGSGQQYALAGNVPNAAISVNMRDVTFSTALRVLLRLGGATYRKEGDRYILSPAPKPEAAKTT